MNKKFTILTASYNCGRYLDDWSDSIVVQDYRPIEVIFVEDKSTDITADVLPGIVDKFARNDIDFKLVNFRKKLHCGSSYNLAMKHGTGTYFGILDSDDMLESHACKFVADLYERNLKVAWIYTQYNKWNRKMTRVMKRGFCHHPGRKSILDREKSGVNIYGHWRTFSNRISSFKNLFGDGLTCCVDKHLGFRLEEVGIGMFVDKVCYRYRTRSPGEKSIVHANPLRKIKSKVIAKAKIRRRNNKTYPVLKYKK